MARFWRRADRRDRVGRVGAERHRADDATLAEQRARHHLLAVERAGEREPVVDVRERAGLVLQHAAPGRRGRATFCTLIVARQVVGDLRLGQQAELDAVRPASAEAIDCSDGIVLISICGSVTLPPQKCGLAATTKEVFGVQLTNWYGPVPSGFLASVPALIVVGREHREVDRGEPVKDGGVGAGELELDRVGAHRDDLLHGCDERRGGVGGLRVLTRARARRRRRRR